MTPGCVRTCSELDRRANQLVASAESKISWRSSSTPRMMGAVVVSWSAWAASQVGRQSAMAARARRRGSEHSGGASGVERGAAGSPGEPWRGGAAV
jgi:hypothetical protein